MIRVLHCFLPSAGQPFLLSRALRNHGVLSYSLNVSTNNEFSYPSDFHIPCSNTEDFLKLFRDFLPNFDIIHFHAFNPFVFFGSDSRVIQALFLLKLQGIRVVCHFRGSEVRLLNVWKRINPFNYVDENPRNITKKYTEAKVSACIDFWNEFADIILVSDFEVQRYVPQSILVPKICDEELFKVEHRVANTPPIVLHAPSNDVIKGTEFVRSAVDQLKSEGHAFTYLEVKGMSNRDYSEILKNCDIFIDQLRIGVYGVASVEALAAGKPVLCYIDEGIRGNFSSDFPIVSVNRYSLFSTVRTLIHDKEMRNKLAIASRDFFQSHHSTDIVVQNLLKIYETLESKPISASSLSKVLERVSVFDEKEAKVKIPSNKAGANLPTKYRDKSLLKVRNLWMNFSRLVLSEYRLMRKVFHIFTRYPLSYIFENLKVQLREPSSFKRIRKLIKRLEL